MQTSILNASHQWQLALAADAAKKDPEQFKIWREDPAKFSFDGRDPLLEVYDKAKEAWKGRTDLCLLCLSASLPAFLSVCLSVCCWAKVLACVLVSITALLSLAAYASFFMHLSVGLQA